MEGRAFQRECDRSAERFAQAMHDAGYGQVAVRARYTPKVRDATKTLQGPRVSIVRELPVERFAGLAPHPPRARATLWRDRWRHILREVSDAHRVDEAVVLGRSKRRRATQARQELYYRMRRELEWSFPQIGEVLCRDHTTVQHGVKRHAERIGATGDW